MNDSFYNNKKLTKNHETSFSGSAAIRFHEPFEPFQTYHLEQLEQNLHSLQEQASFLSFMVGEIKDILDSSSSLPRAYRSS